MRRSVAFTLGCCVNLLLFSSIFCIESNGNEQLISYKENNRINEKNSNQTPNVFIKNMGQWDDNFKFISQTSFGKVGFLENGFLINIESQLDHENEYETIFISFKGSNNIEPKGINPIHSKYHFFNGKTSTDSIDAISYSAVTYLGIYQGIDIVFNQTEEGNLKYQFIVHPNGDPEEIKLKYEGISRIIETIKGVKILTRSNNILMDTNPISFQKENPINSHFIIDDQTITFDIDHYDENQDLIIDPVIYSTYVGGSRGDVGNEIKLLKDGSAIVCGYTDSFDFPVTVGSYSVSNNGKRDAFVFKLNSTGRTMDFSTYIGGSEYDEAKDIVIDKNENILVVGVTNSKDFPTITGCYDDSLNDGLDVEKEDIFLLKLIQNGSSLSFSTFIGGKDYDQGFGIELDQDENILITGSTQSSDFPISSKYIDNELNNGSSNQCDAFIMKVKSDGSDILFSTYIGGSDYERAYDIKTIDRNMAVICGYTFSSDFPTTIGAYDTTFNPTGLGGDGFILKINFSTPELVFSTFIGGSSSQAMLELLSYPNGSIVSTGFTSSSDFPVTLNAFDSSYNTGSLSKKDIVIVSFDSNGSKLQYSSFIGGTGDDNPGGMVTNGVGEILITGSTSSTDFPGVNGCYDGTQNGRQDAFIIRMSKNLSNLTYSTYIGGNQDEFATGIDVNYLGEAFITGGTYSTNFPISNESYDTSSNGDLDVFVFGLNLTKRPSPPLNLSGIIGNKFAQLKWDPPKNDGGSPILRYNIYRGLSNGSEIKISTIGTITKFNDTTISNGNVYYYFITAENVVGESDPSEKIIVYDNTPPRFSKDKSFGNNTTGDIYHFRIIVSDNVVVIQVNVLFWFDLDHIQNITMIQNGNVWHIDCQIPHKVGQLNYSFLAWDTTYNFNRSNQFSINITDNDFPYLISDRSSDQATTGDEFFFEIEAEDNIIVDIVRVNITFPDAVRDTIELSSNDETWIGSIIVPNSLGEMDYFVTMIDSSNNRNVTDNRSINIQDNDLPILIDDRTPDTGTTGDMGNFIIEVQDNIQIAQVVLEVGYFQQNNENFTMSDLSDGIYQQEILFPNTPTQIRYRFHIIDTSGNILITNYSYIQIIDNDEPWLIEDLTPSVGYCGEDLLFSVRVWDNDLLDTIMVQVIKNDIVILNKSMIWNPYPMFIYNIPIDMLGEIEYRFIIRDKSSNINTTILKTINILDKTPPEIFILEPSSAFIGTGETILISVLCSDNIDISYVNLIWKRGNQSWNNITLDEVNGFYNYSLTVGINDRMPYQLKILSSDTSSNINISRVIVIEVRDIISPTIQQIDDIVVKKGENISVEIVASDNIEIDRYIWTGAPITPNENFLIGKATSVGNYSVHVTVYDSSNNSESMSFNISIIPNDQRITPNNGNTSKEKTLLIVAIAVIIMIVVMAILLIYFFNYRKEEPQDFEG